eukprot:m.28154 g.28154  ORF g.28154 m.28154 type:complete len:260 (-) comp9440_c0_seq1:127-906(-)
MSEEGSTNDGGNPLKKAHVVVDDVVATAVVDGGETNNKEGDKDVVEAGNEKRNDGVGEDEEGDSGSRRLRFAVVCSSNQNRSMEAHNFMQRRGFNIKSYGTGSCVKLPGPTITQPNCYEFDSISYDEMYKDLEKKDKQLYTANGILSMLDRNRGIKHHPEKFQRALSERFDVILTCESRVFDEVMKDMEDRGSSSGETVHVCNLDIQDNHDSATVGAHYLVKLSEALEESEDLDDEIEEIVEKFQEDTEQDVMHTVAFY